MTSKAERKRVKKKSPAEIAAALLARRQADFAANGLQEEAAGLPQFADVEVRHAMRAKIDGARRADAFDALKEGMEPGAYDAARRLERDMTIRRGEGDKGRPMLRVDGDGWRDPMDQRIAAGERVKAALSGVGARDAWLLTELIEPKIDRGGWRAIVAYVTGETNDHAQGAAVRSACANLAAAYEVKKAA